MKHKGKYLIFAFLGLIIALFLTHSTFNEEEGVLLFNDDDFDLGLETHPIILVDFYINGCKPCEALAPDYAKAAKKLKPYGVRMAKVNVQASPKLKMKYQINSFPTLKYFKDKIPVEYAGDKSSEKLVTLMKKQLLSPVLIRNTAEELEDLRKVEKILPVLFASQKSPQAEVFSMVAEDMQELTFVICESTEVAQSYGSPSITLFKQFDEGRNDYRGVINKADLTSFIKTKIVPWVMPFDSDADDYIITKKNNAVFLFFSVSESEKYMPILTSLGKSLNLEFAFTYADLNDSNHSILSERLGVSPSQMPVALLLDAKNNRRYVLEGPITQESIHNFIAKFRKKELKPHYMSSEPPDQPFKNGIRILVGSDYEEVVNDPNADVLVMFCAPWCKHCKKLAPEYEKAAKHFENSSVVLAIIDGSVNHIKGVDIPRYPALKFYSGDNKKPVDFNGERTAGGIISYLEKNASTLRNNKS